jgi:hypothetical protein
MRSGKMGTYAELNGNREEVNLLTDLLLKVGGFLDVDVRRSDDVRLVVESSGKEVGSEFVSS